LTLYDSRFYKVLSRNDLGAKGHQGGVVIPRAIADYFPPLPDSGLWPTSEDFVTLDLFDGSRPVGVVVSRWHFQTWHHSRPREYRLTRNLHRALLATAKAGDILTFERQQDSTLRYRAVLVRQGSAEHAAIHSAGQGKSAGVAAQGLPASLAPIESAMGEIEQQSADPFVLAGPERTWVPQQRLFRDAAFAKAVKRAYGHACSACGQGWRLPVGIQGPDPISEPEAAHIVPVALRGPDDVRNGLCLCRAHHWAFDARLIYVDAGAVWRVAPASLAENRNSLLNDLEDTPLTKPDPAHFAPAPEALAWHREQVFSL